MKIDTAVFQAVTPAPNQWTAPKDSQHMMLATKRRHIFEAARRVSISSGLLRSDHEHGDCERKRRIDEVSSASSQCHAREIRLAAEAHPIPAASRT